MFRNLLIVIILASNYAFADCAAPWGAPVAEDHVVTAYLVSNPPKGTWCLSEVRVCTGGTLSGSYVSSWCMEDFSCDGPMGPVSNGAAVLAYAQPIAQNGEHCQSEMRVCSNVILSGSYIHGSCTEIP